MNPEPLAPFIDMFVLGEAEPVLEPLVTFLGDRVSNGEGMRRSELLPEVSLDFPDAMPLRFTLRITIRRAHLLVICRLLACRNEFAR